MLAKNRILKIVTFITILGLMKPLQAQIPPGGILNQKAPSWEVNQWFQLPEGKETLDISDFEGKVVYLYCFQSWCPGCHKYGFPTLQKLIAKFGNDEDVAFVAVQTTFEGFSTNSFERGKEVADQYGLKIPIGHSGSPEKYSELMVSYQTRGTPWAIIIDKNGIVRFNNFHIEPEMAITLINELKAENKGETEDVLNE